MSALRLLYEMYHALRNSIYVDTLSFRREESRADGVLFSFRHNNENCLVEITSWKHESFFNGWEIFFEHRVYIKRVNGSQNVLAVSIIASSNVLSSMAHSVNTIMTKKNQTMINSIIQITHSTVQRDGVSSSSYSYQQWRQTDLISSTREHLGHRSSEVSIGIIIMFMLEFVSKSKFQSLPKR